MYALRKIKDSYRANSKISDFDKIKELVGVAKYNLALINRQVSERFRNEHTCEGLSTHAYFFYYLRFVFVLEILRELGT